MHCYKELICLLAQILGNRSEHAKKMDANTNLIQLLSQLLSTSSLRKSRMKCSLISSVHDLLQKYAETASASTAVRAHPSRSAARSGSNIDDTAKKQALSMLFLFTPYFPRPFSSYHLSNMKPHAGSICSDHHLQQVKLQASYLNFMSLYKLVIEFLYLIFLKFAFYVFGAVVCPTITSIFHYISCFQSNQNWIYK